MGVEAELRAQCDEMSVPAPEVEHARPSLATDRARELLDAQDVAHPLGADGEVAPRRRTLALELVDRRLCHPAREAPLVPLRVEDAAVECLATVVAAHVVPR